MRDWIAVAAIAVPLFGIVAGVVVACDESTNDPSSTNKEWFTNWARVFLDCPSAEVTVTYSGISTKPNWSKVLSFYIIGCGLKVCCDTITTTGGSLNGSSCVPCKQGQWYGKDN